MKIKSTEQLERQIRQLKRDNELLTKKNGELEREIKKVKWDSQLFEKRYRDLVKRNQERE